MPGPSLYQHAQPAARNSETGDKPRLQIVASLVNSVAFGVLKGFKDCFSHRWMGVGLAVACAINMSIRAFATEFHPWNRAARTIQEKMRITGLVLLVTSLIGTGLVLGLMTLVARGGLEQPAWLPEVRHFLHVPTLALGLFVGVLVLTTMQYLGFSVVVKIQAQNFIATTALIPLVTLAMQMAAVRLGILSPLPLDWSVLPAMLVVAGGVLVVIWAGRRDVR